MESIAVLLLFTWTGKNTISATRKSQRATVRDISYNTIAILYYNYV